VSGDAERLMYGEVEAALVELLRRGCSPFCVGPRTEPDAVGAVLRDELWADVVVLRGVGRSAAYRTLVRPGDDPVRATHVVWHYLSDAQRTLRAVLTIPDGVLEVTPYPVPVECRIPEVDRRPLTIRPGRRGAFLMARTFEGEDMTQLAKGQRIRGEARVKLRDQFARQYGKGASIRQIADRSGRSYGFVHRMLVEARVVLRGRGGNTRRPVR